MSSSGYTLISGLGDGSFMAELEEDISSILSTHMVPQPNVTPGLGNPTGMHGVNRQNTHIYILHSQALRHSTSKVKRLCWFVALEVSVGGGPSLALRPVESLHHSREHGDPRQGILNWLRMRKLI